jgi:2-keto-4-pentenoate hydratase/2-oxohepta-3-ene-1,7-dioic acid hydratase in catechol pathway
VVIGREGKYIPKDEALSYVLGYANGNDISARDLQTRTSQWMLGKTLDKFMPIGPYLVTHHDVPDPQNLSIRCWLNGTLRQDSNTRDMIFSVAEIVHYASQYFTLSPGDIITTGTPEGVIFGDDEPRWMQPGDEVIVEIEKLGRLVNAMTQDPQHREV